MSERGNFSIAVLLPCRNEETNVGAVVRAFRKALPDAAIYVYDNGSSDRTVEVARKAGAIVRREPLVGKGNVVRRMFADVDADVYVMADGDGTYDAASAPTMVDLLVSENLDMVVGTRAEPAVGAYRRGHRLGNAFLTGAVAWIFERRFTDMLSGYRVFSRRYVKSFPADARGFATETELTVHSLQMRLPVAEHPTPYAARPEGSSSKLNGVRDGLRIMGTIVVLLKEERPVLFFSSIGGLLVTLAGVLAYPLVATYWETGLVPRLPTAVLVTGVTILAFLSFTCGIILDSVMRSRRTTKRLQYLGLPAPSPEPAPGTKVSPR